MCGLYTVMEQIELGFMFHNLHGLFGFFLYVFDSPITSLTVTYFFISWKLRRIREYVFPLAPLSLSWEYLCNIWAFAHVPLLESVCICLGEELCACVLPHRCIGLRYEHIHVCSVILYIYICV